MNTAERYAKLVDVIAEYAEHCSWRCTDPIRYPWTTDCYCGLTQACREAGFPDGWISRAKETVSLSPSAFSPSPARPEADPLSAPIEADTQLPRRSRT